MKKIILYATIAYFVVLTAIPGYMVFNHYDILRNGETYKIKVAAYDPYDPFRGRYVAIRPELEDFWKHGSAIQLKKDSGGFVVSVKEAENTNAPGVVKNFVLERYYLNEKTAPYVEELQRHVIGENDLVYVTVKVKNGNYAVEGMYINDIPAESYRAAN